LRSVSNPEWTRAIQREAIGKAQNGFPKVWLARTVGSVDLCLDGEQKIGITLDLVDNERPVVANEAYRIVTSHRPEAIIVKCNEGTSGSSVKAKPGEDAFLCQPGLGDEQSSPSLEGLPNLCF
jgi:hypothetical protein